MDKCRECGYRQPLTDLGVGSWCSFFHDACVLVEDKCNLQASDVETIRGLLEGEETGRLRIVNDRDWRILMDAHNLYLSLWQHFKKTGYLESKGGDDAQ